LFVSIKLAEILTIKTSAFDILRQAQDDKGCLSFKTPFVKLRVTSADFVKTPFVKLRVTSAAFVMTSFDKLRVTSADFVKTSFDKLRVT
jgi:hypothetical protein